MRNARISLSIRTVARAAAVLCLFCFARPGLAYSLYGYEDAYGIVHLSESKATEAHVLLYEGSSDPKLGFPAIKRLLREKGAVSSGRKTEWIAETVRFFGPITGVGLDGKFPEVIRGGPVVELINARSRELGVDPWLVYAVVEQESGFVNAAVSPKGAQGLMQLMPETQQTFGVNDPFDPAVNIGAGVRFLRAMLDKYKDPRLALAAYNAGPGAVDRHGGVPPIRETALYVERVMLRYGMLTAMARDKTAGSDKM